MSVPAVLARCFAVAALLATTACSTYLDARAEAALRIRIAASGSRLPQAAP